MKLKLLAQDEGDLQIVASILQDAVVAVKTLHYDRTGHAFTLQGSRFRHETGSAERIFTGLAFNNVLAARHHGIDRSKPEAFAVLLDMAFQPSEADEDPGGTVLLQFAGGGEIALDVEALDLVLADVGDTRAVKAVPAHE